MYFARFALMTRSYGVDAAIAKVPEKFIDDIGLKYDRANGEEKRGRHLSALEIINTLPNDTDILVKPDLWFKEKFIIARRMINKKQFNEAYKLFINHGVEDSSLLAEAEWHAGWLSLRFLKILRHLSNILRRCLIMLITPLVSQELLIGLDILMKLLD